MAPRPRVLAVDDDPEILAMLRRGLGVEGFDVKAAADGQAALAELSRQPVDVVVLDVMMPGTDGLEVLRRIRSTSDVPVLFLSARDRVRDRVAGLDAGRTTTCPSPSLSGSWWRGCERCYAATRASRTINWFLPTWR